MDKKLKRTIGYKPGDTPVVAKKNTPLRPSSIVPEPATPSTNILDVISGELGKVAKIVKWINDHPEFKWGGMCNKIGIDKGNFHRTLKSDAPKIKIEHISQIETFLTNYGYAK